MRKKVTKKESRCRMIKKNKLLIILPIIAIAAGFIVFFGYEEYSLAKIDETIEFKENEAARIGDLSISMEEFMLYSIDVKEGYELQYGDDIWTTLTEDVNGDEATYEVVAKEDTFEQIRLIKALVKKADEMDIIMTEEEIGVLEDTAEEYHELLVDSGIQDDYMTQNVVYQYYEDNYIAQKVYYEITGSTLYDSSIYSSSSTESEYEETESDTDTSDSYDQEELIEIWADVINEYYPDFNYETDINWDLVNQLEYSKTEEDDSNSETESTLLSE